MSSSNPPCAGCKLLRRKCTPECIFAPYFPADQPSKFANVHRVFGASNVTKLLSDLPPEQREDAVRSLSYEAEARSNDPVYGCVRFISVLQKRLVQLQSDLFAAKKELLTYTDPGGLGPHNVPHHQLQPAMSAFAEPVAMGMGLGIVNPLLGQAMYGDQQQLAGAPVVARERMLMSVEQQQEMASMNAAVGFGQMVGFGRGDAVDFSPMAPVLPQVYGFEGSFEVQLQGKHGHLIQQKHHVRRMSNEEMSGAGPSSS